jgi:hypothetical protein
MCLETGSGNTKVSDIVKGLINYRVMNQYC